MLDLVEAVVFWGIGPIFWASGLWSFTHSTLSLARKVIWAIIVITIGAIIGSVLSINMIRNRFVLLLLALPMLAVIDVQLARSKRTYFFWFRACAFEICTVFGTAAMVRCIMVLKNSTHKVIGTDIKPVMNPNVHLTERSAVAIRGRHIGKE